MNQTEFPKEVPPRRIRIGRYSIRLPGSPGLRIALGIALLTGGFLGFLPILGFWMIPLGVVVLSIDIALARRLRRRFEVWWNRRKQKTRR